MPGASASAVGGTAVAASPSRSTAALSTVGVSRRIVIPRWMVLVLAVAAQAAFGQVMLAVPLAGLVPAATVGALVVYAAATRNTALSLCLVAYIPAMEIAVRQSRAPVPYMYGPYLLITIAVLAVFTNYNRMTKPGRTALLYLLLLVPSAIATISVAGSEARELIVFALAGPTAMTLLIVLMSQIRLQAWLHQRLQKVKKQIAYARLAPTEFEALQTLVDTEMHRAELALRGAMKPIVHRAFHGVGLVPSNIIERIALPKIVDEMLDATVAKGFLRFGDLRDILSRNQLKMPDLTSARELASGDPLLRADKLLASRLEGVYQRGPFYLRWLQRAETAGSRPHLNGFVSGSLWSR